MAYTNIDDPSAYFQVKTYTGNSGVQFVTNDGNSDLQPDWVWIKNRTVAYSHQLYDSSRGTTKALFSDLSNAETTISNGLVTFNTDGFGVNSAAAVNENELVAWQWKANGGTTSSNTDGTGITSTVQVNSDAGFSIVTYTGIGSGNANPSVGHGLGVTPQVVLVKGRSQANSWAMYHYGIDGANSRNKYLILNSNGAAGTLANYWGTAASGGVTSSTFGVYADNQSGNNYLNGTHVAYCFASKQGYSKFGKYRGNSSTDGTFVYLGFKPRWVMIKSTQAGVGWFMHDTKRSPTNVIDDYLRADFDNPQGTSVTINIDFLSNGFKLRYGNNTNFSSHDYVYMAFAENPFTTSTGIPTTAR